MAFQRSAGVLLHPTSLPGGYGVGDLGERAYRFIDALASAQFGLWQILPLGPAGGGHSPYQTLSSFAGSPLLISLTGLVHEEVLAAAQLSGVAPTNDETTRYDEAWRYKEPLLRMAWARFKTGKGKPGYQDGFAEFRQAEAAWLDDFTLFMALKNHFDGAAWFQWDDKKLIAREANALKQAREKHVDEIDFQAFLQYNFFSQWRSVKQYANERGIEIIGDVPIYVAHDSADVWASPEFFCLDEAGQPTSVAGVPPDYFSPTGQLWGNPIYDWKALAADDYAWWARRIGKTLETVDRLRIDHFRAFEAYWDVPADADTAIDGQWVPGPGADFFVAISKHLGDQLPIIAEDLGVITPEVDKLRMDLAIPGMKVLQFAFADGADMYRPHSYERNFVVYTATHDNDTTQGWYAAAGADYAHMDAGGLQDERDRVRRYLGRDGSDISWDLIRLALASVADTAIFLAQDALDLPNAARMNRPGTATGNWRWRMREEELAAFPVDRLRDLVELYARGARK